MTAGIIILCRHGSSRLPGKILRAIRGRTVLGHIVDRVRRGADDSPIVVATSTDASDDPIAAYCRRSNFDCFRGPLEDVAGRFLACADSRGWDYAVRINGDNLFVDPDTLRAMLAIASTDAYDFVTNVPGRSFPFGMSVEVLRTEFYRQAIAGVTDAAHREHVTSFLYENPGIGRRFVHENRQVPRAQGLRLALDTEFDLRLCESIVERMDRAPASYGLREITRLATETADPDPWAGSCGPYMIAEIGGNHEGSFERACELTELAIATGVDCIKFQIYQGDTLVNARESPDRNAHFRRFELSQDQHLAIARRCSEAGVHYLASVWDPDSLDWIDPHLAMYKIGSGDLTAWPLLRAFAARGKPIVLSTGLATLDEVVQSVARIQAVDARYARPEWLCLLQCTSMYPIPDHEANLLAMVQLREATGLTVGYSDHTVGGHALRVAAAMGARVLEFHFTDRRAGREFRDHKVSLLPDEVRELQHDLRRIRALHGQALKVPQQSEIDQGHLASFRRAAYLNRDIGEGEEVRSEDVALLRPNHGIDARDAARLVGCRARRPVTAYARLAWDDFVTGPEHD